MPRLDDPALGALCDTVRHNCAISDARYARNYSLCIYLLRMREYFRWHHDLPLRASLDVSSVGDWVTEREMHWDGIEESDFDALPIDGHSFEPFDNVAINRALTPYGLVYSAGLGRMGQPHFLLATLHRQSRHDDITFFECGTEYARDSITLPAMAQGPVVFIRHDSIRRQLWQMLEEWRLHRHDGPMQRVVAHYALQDPAQGGDDGDCDGDGDGDGLDAAAADFARVIREHERGEVMAGRELGERFAALVHTHLGLPGEYYLRSLRDLLADSLQTLPAIHREGNVAQLDLWLAGLNGVRLKWLTTTGTIAALEAGRDTAERLERLADACGIETQRWRRVAARVLEADSTDSDHRAAPDIAAIIDAALTEA